MKTSEAGTRKIAVDGPKLGSDAVNSLATGHDLKDRHIGCLLSEVVLTGADPKDIDAVPRRNTAIPLDEKNHEDKITADHRLGDTLIKEVYETTKMAEEKSGNDTHKPHGGASHCYRSAADGGIIDPGESAFFYDTSGRATGDHPSKSENVAFSTSPTKKSHDTPKDYLTNSVRCEKGSNEVNLTRSRGEGRKFAS